MAAIVEGSNKDLLYQILPFLLLSVQLLESSDRLFRRERQQGDWAESFQSAKPNSRIQYSLPSKCIRLVLSYLVHLIHPFAIPLLLAAVPYLGQPHGAAFSTLLLEHTLIWMLHMALMWQRAKREGGAEEEVLGLAVDCVVIQQALSSQSPPLALVWGAQILLLEWGRRFALANVMHPETINALHMVRKAQSDKARLAQQSVLDKEQEQSYERATWEIVRSLELQWLVSDIDRAATSCLCLVLLVYGGLVYVIATVATALLTCSVLEWCWLHLASSVIVLLLSGCVCYNSMKSNLCTKEALEKVFADEQVPHGHLKFRPPLWDATCLLLSAMGAPTETTATSNLVSSQSRAGL